VVVVVVVVVMVVVLVVKYVNVNFQKNIAFPKNQTMGFTGYYPRPELWMSNLDLHPPAFIKRLFQHNDPNNTIRTDTTQPKRFAILP